MIELTLTVSNRKGRVTNLMIEPEAEQFKLAPGKSYQVVAQGEPNDVRFEVSLDGEDLSLFLRPWSQADGVSVYCDGHRVEPDWS